LHSLFPKLNRTEGVEPAARWLRRNRRALMNAVCAWTNERRFTVDKILRRLTDRCDELDLVAPTDDISVSLRLTSYITTLVMNYLFTGKFARNK
jgi:hypothetical protein